MARDVPPPVSAALAALQAGLDQVRKLPESAAKVPVNAVGIALTAAGKAKRAQHEVLAKVGLASEEKPAPTARGRAAGSTPTPAKPSKPAAAKPAQQKPAEQKPAAERPSSEPTPKAPTERPAKVDTAASAKDAERAEQVAEQVSSGPVPDAGALPLPDFDHMSLGQLRGRLRKLSVEDLVTLRDYEKAHADRLPIVTMLDNRIAKVSAEAESSRALPSGDDASSSS